VAGGDVAGGDVTGGAGGDVAGGVGLASGVGAVTGAGELVDPEVGGGEVLWVGDDPVPGDVPDEVVGLTGIVVVGPADDGVGAVVAPAEDWAGFAVTTTDHFPQVSVTLPFTCPAPESPENQYSGFPP
jgi:hypothetical protein